MARLTCLIFVGANCNVEYQPEGGERRFLAAFSDIQDICYESELMSRGRVVMDVRPAARVSAGVGGGGPCNHLFLALFTANCCEDSHSLHCRPPGDSN